MAGTWISRLHKNQLWKVWCYHRRLAGAFWAVGKRQAGGQVPSGMHQGAPRDALGGAPRWVCPPTSLSVRAQVATDLSLSKVCALADRNCKWFLCAQSAWKFSLICGASSPPASPTCTTWCRPGQRPSLHPVRALVPLSKISSKSVSANQAVPDFLPVWLRHNIYDCPCNHILVKAKNALAFG